MSLLNQGFLGDQYICIEIGVGYTVVKNAFLAVLFLGQFFVFYSTYLNMKWPNFQSGVQEKSVQRRVRNKRYRIAISDAIKFNSDVSPMAHRKVATQNFALQFHSNFTWQTWTYWISLHAENVPI